MIRIAALAGGTFMIVVTVLSLVHAKAWWVRIWDFPRLQIAVIGGAAFAAGVASTVPASWPGALFLGALAYQAALI